MKEQLQEEVQLKISIFGTSGVGKTTYLIMLYHALNNLPGNSDFYSKDGDARTYYTDNLKKFERSNNWTNFFKSIAGTGQYYDISGTLKRSDHPSFELQMMDYMGEWVTQTNFDDDSEDSQKLKSALYNSNAILCFVDAEQAFDPRNGLIKQSTKEDLKNFFRNLLAASGEEKISIPIGIIFNKVDVVVPQLERKNIEGLKEWVTVGTGNLMNFLQDTCQQLDFFFISSKEYYEKWFSKAGPLLHEEMQASRKMGSQQIYDPTGPILWVLNKKEEEIREKQLAQFRADIHRHYGETRKKMLNLKEQAEQLPSQRIGPLDISPDKNRILAHLSHVAQYLNKAYAYISAENIDHAATEIHQAKDSLQKAQVSYAEVSGIINDIKAACKQYFTDITKHQRKADRTVAFLQQNQQKAKGALDRYLPTATGLQTTITKLHQQAVPLNNTFNQEALKEILQQSEPYYKQVTTINQEAHQIIEQIDKARKRMVMFAGMGGVAMLAIIVWFFWPREPRYPPIDLTNPDLPPTSSKILKPIEKYTAVKEGSGRIYVRRGPSTGSTEITLLNPGDKVYCYHSDKTTPDTITDACQDDDEREKEPYGYWCKVRVEEPSSKAKGLDGWIWCWCLKR